MGLLIVPAGFPSGPVPSGQTLQQTRDAAIAAAMIEDRVERAAQTLRALDGQAADQAPDPGKVKVRDHRAPGAPAARIDADLEFEAASGQTKSLTARWGAEELRFRENEANRVWAWDDQGQIRKVTEDRATGTLTVFQG